MSECYTMIPDWYQARTSSGIMNFGYIIKLTSLGRKEMSPSDQACFDAIRFRVFQEDESEHTNHAFDSPYKHCVEFYNTLKLLNSLDSEELTDLLSRLWGILNPLPSVGLHQEQLQRLWSWRVEVM